MKLLAYLLKKDRKFRREQLAKKQQEILVQMGREQFKKLVDRGLTIPVAYL